VSIDDFLERLVEGYMLEDLEMMSKESLPEGKRYGAVGYPMMTTILSGMELLGGLLLPSKQSFDPRKGRVNFLNFWDHYFAKRYPDYAGLGNLMYNLIRHGVAHTFVAKHGIIIHKFSGQPLLINTDKEEVYIDPNVFYKEFKETYNKMIKIIIKNDTEVSGAKRNLMQSRLDRIEKDYSNDSKKFFSELPVLSSKVRTSNYTSKLLGSLTSNTSRASGASTSMAPIDDIPIISTSTTTVPFTAPSGTMADDASNGLQK
jgi:hypothetical protein